MSYPLFFTITAPWFYPLDLFAVVKYWVWECFGFISLGNRKSWEYARVFWFLLVELSRKVGVHKRSFGEMRIVLCRNIIINTYSSNTYYQMARKLLLKKRIYKYNIIKSASVNIMITNTMNTNTVNMIIIIIKKKR